MPKTYIFAIGGTGARVMRSLTMLMAAGIDGLTDTICPIIIDYDKENGDKLRAIESMKRYTAVHNIVQAGKANLDITLTNNKTPFFTPEYKALYPDWCWDFTLPDHQKKFKDYINYDGIGKKAIPTSYLVDTLYDTSNDDVYSELSLDMEVGFQGNPNIGSVVFNELKNDPQFQTFVNDFTHGDKVIVVGSLFGGTGSSGIPKIISAIRAHNNPTIQAANISVVFVLPYFAIDVKSEEDISIKSSIFNSKTKAALNYYSQSGINNLINNIYYVGDKVPTRVEPHIGSKTQKNNAHIVEMISAMAVAHSMTIALNQPPAARKYKFNVGNNIEFGIGINELVGTQADWDNNKFVKNIVHNLINLVYASRFFLDRVICHKDITSSAFYTDFNFDGLTLTSRSTKGNKVQDYCAALYEFICKDINAENNPNADGLWQWLTELHDNSHGAHSLKIFKLSCDEICDVIDGNELRSNKKPFRFVGSSNPTRKPLLTYGIFVAQINIAIAPYCDGANRISKKPKDSYPWIFNDILHVMAEEIRNYNEAELREAFNQIP